ncbi:Leucine rich repeat 5 [uncultured Caudovirales phage]|uniref:Leucine rich repeat 5 n=1 Tax=uncultured Caudovirales phage TaxID=2100421 RepID=A0A6J5NXB1_9CAUD|nr:Leucine rich repeat 5 [uncultured Caudovirales phage]
MSFKVPLISSIQTQKTSTVWTRPVDWITITDASGEVQFLVNDIGSAIFTLRTNYTKPAAQNLYIDWGDGVTTTISATGQTDTAHTYTIGGGTACSLGYTTWKIRVYVDAGATISQCQFIQGTVNGVTQVPFAAIGLLEAYFGEGIGITNYNQIFYSPTVASGFAGVGFFWLKYVKLPASSDNITNMGETFYNCTNLSRVTMPTSMSTLSQSNTMFYSCRSLETITFPSNATGITSIANMFNLCVNLTSVTFPTTLNSVTAADNAFSSCANINNITLPSMTSCTNYSSAFTNCSNLQNVKFTSWTATGVAINLSTMWSNCFSLTTIIWPTTAAVGTTFTGTVFASFSACNALQSITFPSYFGGTAVTVGSHGILSFSACQALNTVVYPSSLNALTTGPGIATCPNLTSVTLPTSMSACTTFGAFTSNPRLTNITLPTTVGATIILGSFQSCSSLLNITIPSGWTLSGTLASKFLGCHALQSVTFPANMNSVTAMNNLFQNCYNLTTVTMPTSMTGVTTIESMFQSCYKLNSIVFPATMNSCTLGLNTFRDCYNLTSVTMPTSMSACTDFSLAFLNCYSLRTLTMPATVNISNYYTQLVQNCSSLTSLTLPTTQTTSLSSGGLTSMLNGCPNLTTVTNMDKVGATSTTVGNVQAGTTFASLTPQLTSTVDLYPRLTKLEVQGTATYFSKVSAVRLRNTGASQWTGTSPQIDVSYTSMSTAQLNTLFADMAAQPAVVSKTINITSATGAAGLSAGDRLVITSKGWTITG